MRKNVRSVFTVLSLLLAQSVPLLSSTAALAAPVTSNVPTSPHQRFLTPTTNPNSLGSQAKLQNLNLSSTRTNTNASLNGASVKINIGGTQTIVNSSTRLTPAAQMAAIQVLQTGHQSLILNANGSAAGGSLTIGSQLSSQLSRLVIPQGVTVNDIAKTGILNIRGSLNDQGNLYLTTTNHSLAAFTVQAGDITVGAHGVLSTILPAGSPYAGLGSANLGLNLNAAKSFTNLGSVSTGGSLAVTAGGAINNGLSASASSSPLMQAGSNVNLLSGSGQINNFGLVSSSNGSINIATQIAATDITVNAQGGTFQALNGDINLRDASYSGSNNINLVGGNYLSQNLNLCSGSGTITAFTQQVSGNLNSQAGVEHFAAATNVLYLCNNTISGDPTFVNLGTGTAGSGNIVISGLNSFGENVAILAAGDITADPANPGSPDEIFAPGSAVTLVAGAGLSMSGTGGAASTSETISAGTGSGTLLLGSGTVTVNFSSSPSGGTPGGFGGNIDLSASTAPVVISTSPTTGNGGNGGNVVLAAFANGNTGGNVILNTAPGMGGITTYGDNSTGQAVVGGSVSIFAGANPASPTPTIQVGNITTGGAGIGGNSSQFGFVNIVTAQPTGNSGTTVDFDATGTIGSGQAIQASALLSASAQVSVGVINTSGFGGASQPFTGQSGGNAGTLTIQTGAGVSAGSLLAFGGGGSGASDGHDSGAGGLGANIFVTAQTGDINIAGDVNSSGGGGGGQTFTPNSHLGGSAGDITLTAQSGNLIVTGLVLASSGGDNNTGLPSGGAGSFGGGGGGGAASSGAFPGGSGYFGGGGSGGAFAGTSGGGGGGGGFSGSGGGGGGANIGSSGGGGGGGTGSTAGSNSGTGGGAGGLGGGSGNGLFAPGGAGGAGGSGGAGPGAGGDSSGGSAGYISGTTFGQGGDGPGATAELAGGSSSGIGGSIQLSGNSVTVSGSIASGPFAGLSIIAQGAGATGSVSINAISGSISPTSIASPKIILNATSGNIGSSVNPVAVSNQNFGGVTLFASATGAAGAGQVFVSNSSPVILDNSSGALTASNSFSLSSSAGDIIPSNSSTAAIQSPSISLSSNSDITGGGQLILNSNGAGNLNLLVNSGGNVNIVDNASETITLANTGASISSAATSFTLGYTLGNGGNIVQAVQSSAGIQSPTITINTSGNIGAGSLAPLIVNSNGSGTLSLFASSGGTVDIADNTSEDITLANTSTNLSAATSFNLSYTNGGGNITQAVQTNAGIVSPIISVSTLNGNIGASSTAPLLINNSASGVNVAATANKSTQGGNVWLSDNVSETITLANTSSPSAAQSFNLGYTLGNGGDIVQADQTSAGIASPTITINTSGNIGAGASSPLIVNSNLSGSLHLFASSGGTVDLQDNASEGIVLANNVTNLSAVTSFTLSYATARSGDITQAVQTQTGIVSPVITLNTPFGNIGAEPGAPITFNNGGQTVTFSANAAQFTGDVLLSHNSAGQLILVNCNAATFELSSTFQDSISGTIDVGNRATITTLGAIGSPSALTLTGPGILIASAPLGVIVSSSFGLNGLITSPSITVNGPEIGSSGQPLNVGNSGSGVILNISSQHDAFISDFSNDTVTLGNVLTGSASLDTFTLFAQGRIAQSGPILGANFLITTGGNITADGTSNGTPLSLTNAGSGIPKLSASAGTTGTVNLSIDSAVSLFNVSPLGSCQSFSLAANGNITAATSTAPAIQAVTITLSASNGNIGSSSNTPLLVNNNGLGLTLTATANGAGGNVWIADNSSVQEDLTLSNSHAGTTFSATNKSGGNILGSVTGPNITLIALAGQIGNTASNINISNSGLGLTLNITAASANIKDNTSDLVLLSANLNGSLVLNVGGDIGPSTITAAAINLAAPNGGIGTSTQNPVLVSHNGSGISLRASALKSVWLEDDLSESVTLTSAVPSQSAAFNLLSQGSILSDSSTNPVIVGTTVSLNSSNGNIGSSGVPLIISNTTSNPLDLIANAPSSTGGQVFLVVQSAVKAAVNVDNSLNNNKNPLVAGTSFSLTNNGNISCVVPGLAISSPQITLTATSGNIESPVTGPGLFPLMVNSNGNLNGLHLSASGSTVAIFDQDKEPVAVGNSVAASFFLQVSKNLSSSTPSVAAIQSQSITLISKGNITADGTAGGAAFLVNSNGHGQLFLSAKSDALVNIADSASEVISLQSINASGGTSFTLGFAAGQTGSIQGTPDPVIFSPIISLSAPGGSIGSPGAPVVISNFGAGIQLTAFVSGTNTDQGNISISAPSDVLNIDNSSAPLTAPGANGISLNAIAIAVSDLTKTAIASPVISLVTSGSIGSSSNSLLVNNGGAGVQLLLNATDASSSVFVRDNAASGEDITLANGSQISSAGNSFVLNNPSGSILTQLPGAPSIFSPNISLTAKNGNIGSASIPIIVTNAGSGVLISVAASGSGTTGSVFLGSTVGDLLTLNNATSPLVAQVSFSISPANGGIAVADSSKTAIQSPSITLVAGAGANITADGTSTGAPVLINSGGNLSGLLLGGFGGGTVALSDNAQETVKIDNSVAPASAILLTINAQGNIQAADMASTAIIGSNIALNTSVGNIGLDSTHPLLISSLAPLGALTLAVNATQNLGNSGNVFVSDPDVAPGYFFIVTSSSAGSGNPVSGTTGQMEITALNTSISIIGPLSASTSLRMEAGGNIAQFAGGLASPVMILTAHTGSIGQQTVGGPNGGPVSVSSGASGTTQLLLNVNALANSTGNGNVYLQDSDSDVGPLAPAILLSGTAGTSPALDNTTGNINVLLTAGSIGIHPAGTVVNPVLQASSSILLNAAQNIVQLHDEIIASPQITLTAGGSIGTVVSGAPLPFLTQTADLNATSTQSMNIANSGDLNFQASSTSGSVTLGSYFHTSTVVSLGNVTLLSGNVSGDTGVSITLNAGKTLTNSGTNQILSNNAPINLNMDNYNLDTTAINAGTGTVTIVPVTAATPITLGSNLTGMALDQTKLNGISAGTLALGSSGASTGSITVNADLNISSSYLLQLTTGGANSYTQTGFALNDVGGVFVNITGTGSISADAITASGALAGVTLQTNGGNTGTINLQNVGGNPVLPNAHVISLIAGSAGTGTINGLGTTPQITPLTGLRRAGNDGGSVFLAAHNLPTLDFTLDVSGAPGGSAGTASYITDSTSTFAITNTPSNKLSINASGGNAGTVILKTGGNLSYDAASGAFNITSNGSGQGLGQGANLDLVAGNVGPGTLLVTGSLSTAGNGTFGAGGSILLGSNSITAFTIGSTSKTLANGISGTLNVAGSGNIDGNITVTNTGGGIIDTSQALTAVNALTFSAGNSVGPVVNGPLTIAKPIGGSGTSQIALLANGTGTIIPGAANLLTADTIMLSSGAGAITAAVNTSFLTATSTSGAVTITNNRIGLLRIDGASGSSFSLTTAGGITNSLPITATTSVSLKSSLINSNIVIGAPIKVLNSNGSENLKGSITISTSGAGSITTSTLSAVLHAASISLTAGTTASSTIGDDGETPVETKMISLSTAGKVNIVNNGFANSPITVAAANTSSAFILSSETSIVLTPSLPNATAVTLTSTGAGNSITVNGSIGNANSTGISLSTAVGTISGTGTLTSRGSINLSTGASAGGQIGTTTAPLKLNTPAITLTDTKTTLFNLSDAYNVANSQITITGKIDSTGAVTYKSSASTLFSSSVTGSSVSINSALTQAAEQIQGAVSASSGSVSIIGTGFGSLNVASDISASAGVTISAPGAATFANISATNLAITVTTKGTTSFSGNILAPGTNGAIAITQTGGGLLTIGSQGMDTGARNTITISTTGTGITALSTIGQTSVPTSVSLKSTSTTGSIILGDNVKAGAKGVTLSVAGSGSINERVGGIDVSSPLISLTTGGSIGAGIGTSVPFIVNTVSLAANSTGKINIQDQATSTMSFTGANPTNQTFILSAAGPVTFAPTLASAQSISISTSNGNITLTGTALGGTTNTGSINLSTDIGSILGNKAVLSTNAGGSVTLTSSEGALGSVALPILLNTPVFNPSAKTDIIAKDLKTGTAIGTVTVNGLNSLFGQIIFTSAGATTYNNGMTGTSVNITTANSTVFNGNISASNLANPATGLFTLTESGSGSTNFNLLTSGTRVLSASGAISIKTVGNTSFAPGTTVTSGSALTHIDGPSIVVNETSGLLDLGTGSSFTVNALSVGKISLLENANAAGAGINLASGATLTTNLSGKSTSTTHPLPGEISLVSGTTVPTNPVRGSSPSLNIIPNPTSKVFFGTNTSKITASGPNNQLNVTGNSDIILVGGSAAGINFGGNVTVTADPPVTATGASVASGAIPLTSATHISNGSFSSMKFSSLANMGAPIQMADLSAANEFKATTSNATASTATANQKNALSGQSLLSLNSIQSNLNMLTASLQAEMLSPQSLRNDIAGSAASSSSHGWVSETELENGQIPVVLGTDTALGISGDLEDLIHLSESSATKDTNKTAQPLSGFVSRNDGAAGAERRMFDLNKGSLVFASKFDSTIKTPYGTINVDANSLVLILSFGQGVAIYDLDDSHKNSVKVSAGGQEFKLYPGMNLLVTQDTVKEFEQINPTQLFAYRNITTHKLNGELKVFSTEFSVPSAIQSIATLQQLMNSKHPYARKLAIHLLKTTAATMQFRAGTTQYRQMLHSSITAWNN